MISARDYAVKILTIHDRSEKELTDKLLKKGYSEEDTEEAVEFCKEYGYIDDERYAAHFVHDASEIKKFGAVRIRNELRMKGIAPETIEEAMLALENEEEILNSEMKRRFDGADFSDPKVKNRIVGYFARRGFSVNDIIRAMGESEEEV